MAGFRIINAIQLYRALKSLTEVSCLKKREDLLFKSVTLMNLIRKSLLQSKADARAFIKWRFTDCLVRVRFFEVDYLFYCPKGYDFNIYLNPYFHEYDITQLVYSTLERGDIFIDVGAHGGLYTLLASKKVGNQGRVISVEPNPENLRFLRLNIKLNRLDNVITVPLAAGEKRKKIKLFYRPEDTARTSPF